MKLERLSKNESELDYKNRLIVHQEKQIDILCDGMEVQREQIKSLKDDLEFTFTLVHWATTPTEAFKQVQELKKKHKLGE